MSLQRVLETARKSGMPVILTDLAGREPMVIMPLEQFEALTGAEDERPSVGANRRVGPTTEVSTIMTMNDPLDRALADMTAEQLKRRMEETAAQLESVTEKVAENPDFSLEERFYLEPVDDKGAV